MLTDEKEMLNVLNIGKEILSEHPEFLSMELNDVMNELDDGTDEMIHNRWGVAAWLVVNRISSFETKELIKYLSKIDSGILTYEYAGYLLQTEYHVNMEELILEADQFGEFDKIVLYVCENISFWTELHQEFISAIISMLGRHKNYRGYQTFLTKYAHHIMNMGAQRLTENILGDLTEQSQYDCMRALRREWYEKDKVEASDVIGRMLERQSIWSKKAAIDFWEMSLYYDVYVFCHYFNEIELLISKNDEFWKMVIPVLVEYVVIISSQSNKVDEKLHSCIMDYLKRIPKGSVEEKRCFLGSVVWNEKIPEDLVQIFELIIVSSFEKDHQILDILDDYLYRQLQEKKYELVCQMLLKVFVTNKFSSKYQDFFETFNSICYELSGKYVVEVTKDAVKYMLLGGIEQYFFGLGLLEKVGNLKKLYDESDTKIKLSDAQMVRLMKGVLYYASDNKKICHTAFQLLMFSSANCDAYMKLCLEEVFENYPETMYEIGEKYKMGKDEQQANLSNKIIKRYEQMSEERNQSYKIKDLNPSREHQYIYHKAQMEQNHRINKMANEASVFAKLFPSRIMKYGKRNAHIVIGKKNEKFYQVNPYMEHKYQVELPTMYINDPVDFELRRRAFLREVELGAIGNKGLSTSIEGER